MLYNKNWDAKTVTSDPFALESLIAWLKKQPAGKTYCFLDNGGCLLAQYYLASGYSRADIGGHSVTLDGEYMMMPEDFGNIPVEYPRTFGAALTRARAALAAQ